MIIIKKELFFFNLRLNIHFNVMFPSSNKLNYLKVNHWEETSSLRMSQTSFSTFVV